LRRSRSLRQCLADDERAVYVGLIGDRYDSSPPSGGGDWETFATTN
jgi:hypothetical protein